jgi:ABC-type antimicrobial peptide transport system permease subunit
VDSVAPIVSTRQQVVFQNKNWNPASLLGTTPGFLRVREWEEMDEGEPFTDEDVRDGALVCLLGQTLVRELFGERSPIGQEVLVKDVPMKIIGVLRKKGADIVGEDQDDILLAPWTTIKYRVSAGVDSGGPAATAAGAALPNVADQIQLLSRRYPRAGHDLFVAPALLQALNTPKLERIANVDTILVRSVATSEIPAAMAQITDLLRHRHSIASGQADDFSVRDFTEVVAAVRSTVNLISQLLLCVALIALVVGGVGIMNIMLVSVTERYREIGLRMAVGARPRDILLQFLVESVVLCLMGGLVGILVGRGTSLLVRHLAGWPTQPSWGAMIASVAISATVGIAFGYYPAWKASRLNPIEALSYE